MLSLNPTQNAFGEALSARFRDERLNENLFWDLARTASDQRVSHRLQQPAASLGPRLSDARRVRRDVPTAPGPKARCINRSLEQHQRAGSGSDWRNVGAHSKDNSYLEQRRRVWWYNRRVASGQSQR